MAGILDELGLRFLAQHRLAPKVGAVDFYLPDWKVVIEVDGCYWHGCAACGGDGWDRSEGDRDKTQRLAASGYAVLRFWEHQVRRDAPRVRLVIASVVAGDFHEAEAALAEMDAEMRRQEEARIEREWEREGPKRMAADIYARTVARLMEIKVLSADFPRV
jgi:very-short-patch-repair endonuclease